jgi:hypothetical protein
MMKAWMQKTGLLGHSVFNLILTSTPVLALLRIGIVMFRWPTFAVFTCLFIYHSSSPYHLRRVCNNPATILVCFDTFIAENHYGFPDVWVLKVDGGEERVNGTLS